MKLKTLAIIAVCLSWNIEADATQYSKLAIITAAKSVGRWDTLKAWIQQAGYYDEWLVASYLSDEYEQYPAITNAIVSAGVCTAQELATILAASKDTAMPDALLNGRYRRDVESESGRVSWHGKRVKTEENTNTLVQTFTYADGTAFSFPFSKAKPMTVAARFALEEKRKAEAEKKRLAQMPPRLQDIERQRQETLSHTNEVVVDYGPEGAR